MCNRKLFHATESAISLIHWNNNLVKSNIEIELDSDIKRVKIKKVFTSISSLYPKQKRTSNPERSLNTYNLKWSFLLIR